jgi:hypothetical protein
MDVEPMLHQEPGEPQDGCTSFAAMLASASDSIAASAAIKQMAFFTAVSSLNPEGIDASRLWDVPRNPCQTTRFVKEDGLYEGAEVLRNTKHRPAVIDSFIGDKPRG